jgi:hypothetical protein
VLMEAIGVSWFYGMWVVTKPWPHCSRWCRRALYFQGSHIGLQSWAGLLLGVSLSYPQLIFTTTGTAKVPEGPSVSVRRGTHKKLLTPESWLSFWYRVATFRKQKKTQDAKLNFNFRWTVNTFYCKYVHICI